MNAASQDHGPDGDRNVRSADIQLEVIDSQPSDRARFSGRSCKRANLPPPLAL
jgi:hypothetical protein